jgi:hypothetical protein
VTAAPAARAATATTAAVVLVVVAGVLGAVALLVITAIPAGAAGAPAEPCDGVLVVVDARGLGGAVTIGCAEGAPSTGLAALEATGHTYAFLPTIPGLVCTIDGQPDPCNGLPDDAYWGYWHAPGPDGPWGYSTRGAGFRTPPVGSVEGWRFGDGSEPPDLPSDLLAAGDGVNDGDIGDRGDRGDRGDGDDASADLQGSPAAASSAGDGDGSRAALLGGGLLVGLLGLTAVRRHRQREG